jgi:hypothetical protein
VRLPDIEGPRRAIVARPEGWRWYRPLALALTLGLLAFLCFELAIIVPRMRPESFGVDFHQYLDHTRRWLDGGSLFLERQLQGPYQIQAGDSLYPPNILYLTVPFVAGVPELIWWLIPVGITAAVIVRHRPAPMAWVLIAAMLATPRSIEILLYGNPVIWVTAALAAGTVLYWPSVGVLLKPSLLPLALWGVTRRSWWVALAVYGVAALPFGTAWLEWVQVIRDSSGSVVYSAPDLLYVLVPVVAWLARMRGLGAATEPAAGLVPARLEAS